MKQLTLVAASALALMLGLATPVTADTQAAIDPATAEANCGTSFGDCSNTAAVQDRHGHGTRGVSPLAATVPRATFLRYPPLPAYCRDVDGFVVARAHGPADRMVTRVKVRPLGRWQLLAVRTNVSAGTRMRVSQLTVVDHHATRFTRLKVYLRNNGHNGTADRCHDLLGD
jgi:hypothetical protein